MPCEEEFEALRHAVVCLAEMVDNVAWLGTTTAYETGETDKDPPERKATFDDEKSLHLRALLTEAVAALIQAGATSPGAQSTVDKRSESDTVG